MEEYRVTLDRGGLNRDFVFVGGPIEDLNGGTELFKALGFACAQWARLEQHIDAVLMHINNEDHSATIFNADHPVSFSNKIDLLKRWFNKHPALANLAEHVRTLTSKLKEVSPHRNNLIHGVLDSWEPATQTAVFRTVKGSKEGEFKIATHEYTIAGITNVAELIAISNKYLSGISRAVFTTEALAQLRETSTRR